MISYWGQFRIGDGSFREKCPIGTGSFWDILQKEPSPIRKKKGKRIMTNLIIAAVVLIVIMLVFIFILFKNIIKRMDENAKKYFVNKMQDYDYILEEKQAKLEEIKSEISEIKAENRNILKDDEEYETGDYSNKKNNDIYEDSPKRDTYEEVKYNLNVPDYRETQFFNNYKEVRKVFTVNNEKIIKEFIAEHKNLKEEKEYKSLEKLRKKFDEETIYGCLTLSSEDQIAILKDALTATEKKLVNFDELTKKNKFNVEDLIKYIDDRMEQIDPTICIYTNVLDKKYEEIDSNIITKEYCNMSEGIIIKYRNKIYDYSI